MKYLLILFTSCLVVSCSRTKSSQPTFESIIESDSLHTQLYGFLEGKWRGYYECLEFTVDTTFYNSYEEKLEFMLTNSVTDSTLIKEVILKQDTIKRPIFVVFNIEDKSSRSNNVVVETSSTKRVFPFSTRYSIFEYKNSERELHFGEDEGAQGAFMSLPDGTLISNVLDDSLSWDNIDLTIELMNRDSAIFNFKSGVGQLVLIKER